MSRGLRPGKRVAYYDNETYSGYAELAPSPRRWRLGSKPAGAETTPARETRSRTTTGAASVGVPETSAALGSESPDPDEYDSADEEEKDEALEIGDHRKVQSPESSEPSTPATSSNTNAQPLCTDRCTHQRRCLIRRLPLPLGHPKESSSTPALEAPGYLFKCDRCKAKYKNGKNLANHLMSLGVPGGHGYYSPVNMFVVSSFKIEDDEKTWGGRFEFDEEESYHGEMVVDEGEEGEEIEDSEDEEVETGEAAGGGGIPEYWKQVDALGSDSEDEDDEGVWANWDAEPPRRKHKANSI